MVIGGGSFGGVIAHRLFQLDSRLRQHRILVLEGRSFLVPEHVQNLPTIGDIFGEVKRLPWQPSPSSPGLAFPGLAFCLAGRSLFWGGWSPQLMDSELAGWPLAVVKDFKDAFFAEARRQIGTDAPNDFIFGPLHDKLRDRLFNGIGNVTQRFGINTAADLEAPLAVVSASVRAGTFPINKFSSMPLLMDAARKSWVESSGDDRKKRLMIVPNCTVQQLGLTGNQVTLVKTNVGALAVPANGAVVIALGTIESTRLALRRTHRALHSRGFFNCYFDQAHLQKGVIVCRREAPALGSQLSESLIVYLNFSDQDAEVWLPFPTPGTWLEQLDGTHPPLPITQNDQWSPVIVPSNCVGVYKRT